MNRLTMLAVTLMASIACFAQGNSGEATEWGQNFGPDYQELKYDVTVGSPFQVSVIGFSDAVVNDPTIMNNPPDKGSREELAMFYLNKYSLKNQIEKMVDAFNM